ncbi:MAG: hypothetical protein H0X66_16865 [Verrucomicrobia bacterium]|nr:hypothetical protein [Verrucomicrobiota bacterium]
MSLACERIACKRPNVNGFLQTTGVLIRAILLIALFLAAVLAGAAERDKVGGTEAARITVHITEPSANSEIEYARVDVRGKLESNVPIKRVFSGGNLASISKNEFVVRNVVLQPGTNVITVMAEESSGTFVTNSLTVIGKGEDNKLRDPVRLRCGTQVGFSPLEVEFSVDTDLPGPIENVLWDFDGDGLPDLETKVLQAVKYTYVAGSYAPVVTVRTKNGEYSSIGGFNLNPWVMWKDMPMIYVEERPKQTGVIAVSDPVDIEVGTNGSVYVLSRSTATLTEFDINGKPVRSLDKLGSAPHGFTVDSHKNVYVALTDDNQVIKLKPTENSFELDLSFGKTGRLGNKDKSAGAANEQFNKPYDIALNWHSTVIYVSDSQNHRIQAFKNDGTFLGITKMGINLGEKVRPRGLARNSGGLVTVDADQNRLLTIYTSVMDGERYSGGMITDVIGQKGSLPGQFTRPHNVGSRGGDAIYVADTGNDRIQKLDRERGAPVWMISKELGLKQPEAVFVPENLLEERIYIADTGNNRIVIAHVPRGDPALVWKQMLDALIKQRDQEKALGYFTSEASEKYRQAIQEIGLEAFIEDMRDIKGIVPVEIDDNTAEYRFDYEIENHILTFPIHFYKERGQWRIQEF